MHAPSRQDKALHKLKYNSKTHRHFGGSADCAAYPNQGKKRWSCSPVSWASKFALTRVCCTATKTTACSRFIRGNWDLIKKSF